MKVEWKHCSVGEATWEIELEMRADILTCSKLQVLSFVICLRMNILFSSR